MADCIKLLPDVVANQIAAGEVVNRPSSVVKEMMENAIDAGATSVTVNTRGGGREMIQIVDNGCGMSPVDARMAFDRHATSKISSVADIYNLHTFGFRGEALASIAAVAQVELRTRQRDDELGTQTLINGGEFVSQEPILCAEGSQFYVRNLFYNVPARRRFLEKNTVSSRQIKAEFQRVALCNPDKSFDLYDNDASIYHLMPSSLAGRIVDVIGRHMRSNLLEVDTDTSIVRINGFVGAPSAAKKSNVEQYFFVNGRYFNDPYLRRAVLKAYEKLIPDTCFPSYFLYLTVSPDRVDVNVHPQKTEVKFEDKDAVWEILLAAVRSTLGRTGAIPMMDFNDEGHIDIPIAQQGAYYNEPSAVSNEEYNPFAVDEVGVPADHINPTPEYVEDVTFGTAHASDGTPSESFFFRPVSQSPSDDVSSTPLLSDAQGEYEEFTSEELQDIPIGASVPTPISTEEEYIDLPTNQPLEPLVEMTPSTTRSLPRDETELQFESATSQPQQQNLLEMPQATFGELIFVAPGYVVALLGKSPVVVDLRRARERLLYDAYLTMISAGSSVSQKLLFPERLVLSYDDYELLQQYTSDFKAFGFDIAFLGEGTIDIQGTPADMPIDTVDELIYRLLQAFSHESADEMRRKRMASELARAGAQSVARCTSHEEARRLLEQLQQSENRCYTPFGKRIFAPLSMDELRLKLK
jgi:DNA mismatch repair protein MutL